MYDVLIIGAGVVGCAVARELSRYALKIGVLEREEDVGAGTSKANSAIVHAGFDAEPGTLKARFNVLGSAMMDELSAQLDIPFRRNGALVVARTPEDEDKLLKLLSRGRENGVAGLELISGDEARRREPALANEIRAALCAPGSGVVCPFELTQALAENACLNGAEFIFNARVRRVCACAGGFRVEGEGAALEARALVNCAGLYSDVFHNQLCADQIAIEPRRGEYLLLDRKAGSLVRHTIFQAPGPMGKGVLVTPTVHGNLMLGPTAQALDDREATNTSADGLELTGRLAALSVPKLPLRQTITSFAGLRAHLSGERDFRVGEPKPFYFEAAGIESPGLSAAPAIGAHLAGRIAERLHAEKKRAFDPLRRVVRPREMCFEARQRLIREHPAYGSIVCRCEQVSEGEILDAIRRPLGARSLDGVKRRTRAGMGRCQAGFCSPRVMELLRRELGDDFEITKCGAGSPMTLEKGEVR